MSSMNASALFSRIHPLHWLSAILLFVVPQLVLAQTTTEPPPPADEDPFLFTPSAGGPGDFASYLCRGSSTGFSCAAEMGLGERSRIGSETGPDAFTFVLATHETVRLETRGEIDTRGTLFDAEGRALATDDDGGRGRNFRITRTLAPGRYYLAVAAPALPAASYELRTAAVNPLGGSGAGAGRDAGNHCGRAHAVAGGAVDGRFERRGDVDVYGVELAAAGELAIAVEGPVRYELKAADCATSIGLADGSLGTTVTRLAAGSYFLYVSQPPGAVEDYRLRLEIR